MLKSMTTGSGEAQKRRTDMKRIMNGNGSGEWSISSDKYYEAFARLAAIEDILGDDYDLDRL